MYIEQEINLTDIQAGDRLTATAQEDIKEVKEFKVIEITVQFRLRGEPTLTE